MTRDEMLAERAYYDRLMKLLEDCFDCGECGLYLHCHDEQGHRIKNCAVALDEYIKMKMEGQE